MPTHEIAPSGHDVPDLGKTSLEMMAEFRAAKPKLPVVDYFAGATREQIQSLPNVWKPAKQRG